MYCLVILQRLCFPGAGDRFCIFSKQKDYAPTHLNMLFHKIRRKNQKPFVFSLRCLMEAVSDWLTLAIHGGWNDLEFSCNDYDSTMSASYSDFFFFLIIMCQSRLNKNYEILMQCKLTGSNQQFLSWTKSWTSLWEYHIFFKKKKKQACHFG